MSVSRRRVSSEFRNSLHMEVINVRRGPQRVDKRKNIPYLVPSQGDFGELCESFRVFFLDCSPQRKRRSRMRGMIRAMV